MERPGDVKPNFPVDAFAGTAAYYLRFRLPYPDDLVQDLVLRARLSGRGRLVDLASGPGPVAFALRSQFAAIWAVDLEPEMIEAGRREAARLGASNITWLVGRVEDFAGPPGPAELVTIGEAFHRLEQGRTVANAFAWLRPGGCLATLGTFSALSGREAWQRIVVQVVHRWTSGKRRTSDGQPLRKPEGSLEHNERVLRESGFTEVATHRFPRVHVWSLEDIVGYLYSTSAASRSLLGKDVDAFEVDLRAALLAHDSSGTYQEDPQWSYTFGRKPL